MPVLLGGRATRYPMTPPSFTATSSIRSVTNADHSDRTCLSVAGWNSTAHHGPGIPTRRDGACRAVAHVVEPRPRSPAPGAAAPALVSGIRGLPRPVGAVV